MIPDLTLENVAMAALATAAAYFGGKLLFKKDTEREARQRAAQQLGSKLQAMGLKRIPDLLFDYAIQDYSGIAKNVHEVSRTFLNGEEAVLAEFDQVYKNVLSAKLKNPEGLAYLESQIAEAKQTAEAKK